MSTLKERLTDPVRLKQAAEEAFYTALAAITLPFLGYLSGLQDLPNLEALDALWRSAQIGGLVALGKAGLWLFTGTKVARDKRNV